MATRDTIVQILVPPKERAIKTKATDPAPASTKKRLAKVIREFNTEVEPLIDNTNAIGLIREIDDLVETIDPDNLLAGEAWDLIPRIESLTLACWELNPSKKTRLAVGGSKTYNRLAHARQKVEGREPDVPYPEAFGMAIAYLERSREFDRNSKLANADRFVRIGNDRIDLINADIKRYESGLPVENGELVARWSRMERARRRGFSHPPRKHQ